MILPDFRMAVGMTYSERAKRSFPKPKPTNTAAKLGLRYENNVGKELARFVPHKFQRLEHNPWFTFYDNYGTSNCSPDFLLWLDDRAIIIEVKLTWVEVALPKLHELYCPVVSCALGCAVMPLVICRNVTPKAPKAAFSLCEALISPEKLLIWPNTGQIQW